ncbi:MAG: hypothetical protein ABIH20_01250 [Candidatus Diapherotrites archaeon]
MAKRAIPIVQNGRRSIPDSKERLKRLMKSPKFDFNKAYREAYPKPIISTIKPEKFNAVCTLLLASDYSGGLIARLLNVDPTNVNNINKKLKLRSQRDVEVIKALAQSKAHVKLKTPKPTPRATRTPKPKPLKFWQRGLALLRRDKSLKPELRKRLIERAEAEIAQRTK